MKQKIFFIIITAPATIIAIVALMIPISASAAPGFGGRIQSVSYCCNGILLRTGPPTPISGGLFVYPYGAPLYSWYQIYRPGAWILGNYEPPGSCFTGTYCATTIVAVGFIMQAGTSLY